MIHSARHGRDRRRQPVARADARVAGVVAAADLQLPGPAARRRRPVPLRRAGRQARDLPRGARATSHGAGARLSAHADSPTAEHEHHGPAKYTFQPNPFKLRPHHPRPDHLPDLRDRAVRRVLPVLRPQPARSRAYEWPQPGFEIPADATSFNTAILMASSFTCELVLIARAATCAGPRSRGWSLTILLGSAFLGLQAREYIEDRLHAADERHGLVVLLAHRPARRARLPRHQPARVLPDPAAAAGTSRRRTA